MVQIGQRASQLPHCSGRVYFLLPLTHCDVSEWQQRWADQSPGGIAAAQPGVREEPFGGTVCEPYALHDTLRHVTIVKAELY